MKSSDLNRAWLTECSSAAVSASPAATAFPEDANMPANPIPSRMRPTFAQVENASSRLRSRATAACMIP
jgi:hypothetical protein